MIYLKKMIHIFPKIIKAEIPKYMKKNIFLIGWGAVDLPDQIEVAKELDKKHNISYWVTNIKGIGVEESDFPNTIFHDLFDALNLLPAQSIDSTKFTPPSEKFIKEMVETESILISMMNKKFEWMGTEQRKNYYYQLLQYWWGVLQTKKPDIIIFPAPPHTLYDYVIYALSKKTNIKTIIFEFTRIGDRMLIANHFEDGYPGFKKKIEEYKNKEVQIEDLPKDIKEHYFIQTEELDDPIPPDTKEILGIERIKRVVGYKGESIKKSIKDFSIFYKSARYIVKKFKSNLQKEYGNVVNKNIDIEAQFIYFTLHYQPESTTCPKGGVYNSQILTIRTLAAALPKGWKLYIKEHPAQWLPRGFNFFSYRYKGFYREISKINGVEVLPIFMDSRFIASKAKAVVTTTGTPGWEAVLQGTPAIIFGYTWYRNCPGIFQVRSTKDCKKALEIIQNTKKISQQDILCYLAAFGAISFRAYLEWYTRDLSSLTPEENKRNIVQVILKYIDSTETV